MIRRPPRSTRTDTLFPYTTLFRSLTTQIAGSGLNGEAPQFSGPITVTPFSPRKLLEAFGVKRSEEHTSELQSLMRISYAVFCLKKKKTQKQTHTATQHNTTSHRRPRYMTQIDIRYQ